MFFMSRKRYMALPQAARSAIDKITTEATTREFGAHLDKQWEDSRAPVVGDAKHAVAPLGSTEKGKWQAKAEPLLAEWAKERPNGDKVLEAYRKLYSEVKSR
jgi:TRAP-type C4-dicarboxylate transport system substrate-binding protein